jgi:hypothetical protein
MYDDSSYITSTNSHQQQQKQHLWQTKRSASSAWYGEKGQKHYQQHDSNCITNWFRSFLGQETIHQDGPMMPTDHQGT